MTLIFVALIGVGFNDYSLPEPEKLVEVGDGKRVLGEHLEASTTKGSLDAMPVTEGHCEGSTPPKVGEAMVIHGVHHQASKVPTVLVHRAECEGLNRLFRQPRDKGQVRAVSSLINTDASIDSPIARDDETSPSTPVAEASHDADGTLYSCEEISTMLDKMTHGGKV